MIKKPKNDNYTAMVVELKTFIDLDNCDNVKHASIFGNLVIVSKEAKEGDVGIFFPIETQLTKDYLSNNNLYRDSTLNKDPDSKGYFEVNGRIKAMKFRGHRSMGLFMPLSSLDWTNHNEELKVGDTFDELNGLEICRKYIVLILTTHSPKETTRSKRKKKESILLENQFKFHVDTSQLGKNTYKINPDTLIHITRKIHGTSFISSNILCKKRLSIWDRIGKTLGFNVVGTEYRNIYSSRKVVKNDEMNPVSSHYYSEDIWGKADERVKEHLTDGMTVYGEIVGYLSSDKMIQKGYDYGCKPGEFEIYVYRITQISPSGNVVEFSANQVQSWCKLHGLKSVTEYYFGKAGDLFDFNYETLEEFRGRFLYHLQEYYLEKPASDCITNVPDEGIVVRIEDSFEIDPYKLKSFAFYQHETKSLDNGEEDIESSE